MIEPNQIETTTTQTFPDWVTEALDAHEDQTPTAECEIERLRRIGRIAETVLADDFASRIAHDLNACVSAVEAAAWRENSQASGSMELWAQVGLKLAQSALAAGTRTDRGALPAAALRRGGAAGKTQATGPPRNRRQP